LAACDVTLNGIDLNILWSLQVYNYFLFLQLTVFLFFVVAPHVLKFY